MSSNEITKHAIESLQEEIFKINKDNGWWEKDRNKAELLMLMVSELSECLEYLRHGNKASDHIPEFTGEEEEIADTVIRILDYSHAYELRLFEAIKAKLLFNKTRGYKHGNKTC